MCTLYNDDFTIDFKSKETARNKFLVYNDSIGYEQQSKCKFMEFEKLYRIYFVYFWSERFPLHWQVDTNVSIHSTLEVAKNANKVFEISIDSLINLHINSGITRYKVNYGIPSINYAFVH